MNRTMQAKNAKAKKWAIQERKFRENCEIQTDHVRSRLGIVSYYDQLAAERRKTAKAIADHAQSVKFPEYIQTKTETVVDGHRVPIKFSEESRFWEQIFKCALMMLEKGMSEDFIRQCAVA